MRNQKINVGDELVLDPHSFHVAIDDPQHKSRTHAGRITAASGLPVICVGGWQTASRIREALAAGKCDVVSLACWDEERFDSRAQMFEEAYRVYKGAAVGVHDVG